MITHTYEARIVWLIAAFATLTILAGLGAAQTVNVSERGLQADGATDQTDGLQRLLDQGEKDLYFPPGDYLLATVRLPADTHLRFAPDARVVLHTEKLLVRDGDQPPVFRLKGDGITLEGVEFTGDMPRGRAPAIITGSNLTDLTFRRLRMVDSVNRGRQAPTLIELDRCRAVLFENSYINNIQHGIVTRQCADVTVRGNRAINCNTLTTFRDGSQSLRHDSNWSRGVVYQCVFRGGAPDPSRKAPRVPLGSSTVVVRDPLPDGDAAYYLEEMKKAGVTGPSEADAADGDFQQHLAGTFDIEIVNNYAEYGRTLAWGNKGRQVIFDGNIARFMNDYCFGVEGAENVIFSNNIAINGRASCIMTMYWGEKLVISGNVLLVRDEPYVPEHAFVGTAARGRPGDKPEGEAKFPSQSAFHGDFVTLHHGPGPRADREAGSRYGGGSAVITGNLMVNELHDKIRRVRIWNGRDVMVSGNKIINGVIFKNGAGTLTACDNEFLSDMPHPHNTIRVGGMNDFLIIKDNVMQFGGGQTIVERREDFTHEGFDEAEATDQQDITTEDQPAIHVTNHRQATMIVQGNVIDGWPEGIKLEVAEPADGDQPPLLILHRNSLNGTIGIVARDPWFTQDVQDNLDLHGFEPIEAKQVEPQPSVKKKKKKKKKSRS